MKKYDNARIKSESHLVSAFKSILSSGAHNSVNFQPIWKFDINLYQVILHQVITREQGKKYCETLPAPFQRHDLEFSGGVPIEKTNNDSLNLPCHKVYML